MELFVLRLQRLGYFEIHDSSLFCEPVTSSFDSSLRGFHHLRAIDVRGCAHLGRAAQATEKSLGPVTCQFLARLVNPSNTFLHSIVLI